MATRRSPKPRGRSRLRTSTRPRRRARTSRTCSSGSARWSSSGRASRSRVELMREKGFRELLKDAYFYGANGILAVADLTRRRTLDDLDDWIDGVEPLIGKVPVLIVVNKADLTSSAQFTERDVAQFAKAYGSDFLLTHAKTGEHVESAFTRLASVVVEGQLHPA